MTCSAAQRGVVMMFWLHFRRETSLPVLNKHSNCTKFKLYQCYNDKSTDRCTAITNVLPHLKGFSETDVQLSHGLQKWNAACFSVTEPSSHTVASSTSVTVHLYCCLWLKSMRFSCVCEGRGILGSSHVNVIMSV